MADTDFSNLPATNTIAAADQILLVRNGAAYRFSGSLPMVSATGRLTVTAGASNNLLLGTNADFPSVNGLSLNGALSDAGNVGMFGGGTENNLYLQAVASTYIRYGNVIRWTFLGAAGALTPGGDNTQDVGSASSRLRVIYAGTGTINTSDEREKHWRGELTEGHLRAARRIVREIGLFQWINAREDKGKRAARHHIGPRAQAVARIMVDEGLEKPFEDGSEPRFRHAFLCYDRWDAEPATDEVRDDDGEVVTPAQPARLGGDRFGLRIDQLTMFLLAAEAQRHDELEARLAAIEAA